MSNKPANKRRASSRLYKFEEARASSCKNLQEAAREGLAPSGLGRPAVTQVSLRSVIKGGGDRAWGARRATPFSFPNKVS